MEFIKTDIGFKLFVSGREIINHSSHAPWIYAGSGTVGYGMRFGDFSIEDDVM